MPSSRSSSSRGPGPRRGSRPISRPTSRPGQRTPAGRTRAQAAGRATVRPRFTGRAAVLVLVLAVLMVSYASSMRAYLEQKEHLQALRASIEDSQVNIAALEREKKRWKDDAFIEAQARERLGWVMVGETAYQVIDENGEPLAADESLSEPTAEEEADQPEWWQRAWGSVEAAGNPPQQEQPAPAEQIRAPKPKKKQ